MKATRCLGSLVAWAVDEWRAVDGVLGALAGRPVARVPPLARTMIPWPESRAVWEDGR